MLRLFPFTPRSRQKHPASEALSRRLAPPRRARLSPFRPRASLPALSLCGSEYVLFVRLTPLQRKLAGVYLGAASDTVVGEEEAPQGEINKSLFTAQASQRAGKRGLL